MNEKDVISFFDSLASSWDEKAKIDEEIIRIIMDNASIDSGSSVLDIACGTGILFPDYLKRGVRRITGVDISGEMIKRAKSKFKDDNIRLICAAAEKYDFEEKYDHIVIYNALPHFSDPELLIKKMSAVLSDEGTLTIAHGMSLQEVNMIHDSVMNVSRKIAPVEDLKVIMNRYLKTIIAISDDRMYQIVATK